MPKCYFKQYHSFLKFSNIGTSTTSLTNFSDAKSIIGTLGTVGTLFSAFGAAGALVSAAGLFAFLQNKGSNDTINLDSNYNPDGPPDIPSSLTNFSSALGNVQQFNSFHSMMKQFGYGNNNNKLYSRRNLLLNINSTSALSNFDIEEIIQKEYNDFDHKFKGTFCWDELVLPIPNRNDEWGIIVNTLTTNAKSNDVGHWIALVINNSKRQFYYYDSFGDNPQQFNNFKELLKKYKKYNSEKYELKINAVQNQNSNTSNCGFFAINFLENILQDHVSFKTATDFNSVVGEKKIALLKKSFGLI